MTPLLAQLRRDGLELQVDGADLIVRGPSEAVARWRAEIVAQKSVLLAVLRQTEPIPAAVASRVKEQVSAAVARGERLSKRAAEAEGLAPPFVRPCPQHPSASAFRDYVVHTIWRCRTCFRAIGVQPGARP